MNNLEEIEITRKEAQKVIDRGAALDRLSKNRDFRKIVTEGYFKEEASRLALISAEGSMNKEQQESVADAIRGISHLSQYFRILEVQAGLAKESLEELDQLEEEIENEGAE